MQPISLGQFLENPEDFSLTGLIGLDWVGAGADAWLVGLSETFGAMIRVTGAISGSPRLLDPLLPAGAATPLDMLCLDRGGQSWLYTIDRATTGILARTLTDASAIGAATGLSFQGGTPQLAGMASFSTASGDYMVGISGSQTRLQLYEFTSDWQLALRDTVVDTPKSAVTHVSDVLTVTSGGATYVISASATESSLSSYRLTSGGDLEFADTITPRDGLWVSGFEAMETIEIDGQSYIIGASAHSSSLSVVRVNPMGVFFVEDIETDTQHTRFAGARALDSFQAEGRDFIAVAGSDGGLSLFELLPGGDLFHHQSLTQSTAWNVGPVSALSVILVGDTAHIAVAGSAAGGLALLDLPLSDLGARQVGTGGANTLTGSAGADMLLGGAGNDTLRGGAGDDVLIAGPGADRLTGGAGADTFVFTADGQTNTVTDFALGTDRLDLSGWGLLYHHGALDISGSASGAVLRWNDEHLVIQSSDGNRIDPDDWQADDFLF